MSTTSFFVYFVHPAIKYFSMNRNFLSVFWIAHVSGVVLSSSRCVSFPRTALARLLFPLIECKVVNVATSSARSPEVCAVRDKMEVSDFKRKRTCGPASNDAAFFGCFFFPQMFCNINIQWHASIHNQDTPAIKERGSYVQNNLLRYVGLKKVLFHSVLVKLESGLGIKVRVSLFWPRFGQNSAFRLIRPP